MNSRKKTMLKRGIFIGVAVLLIGIIILLFALSEFYNSGQDKTIKGNSIKDIGKTAVQTYALAPSYAKKMLLIMWGLFFIVIIGIFIRDKIMSERKEIKITITPHYGEFETDLDVLYRILEQKKSLKISTIAQAFKISREKAMEWAKILELGNLATIEYPGMFREPEIILIKDIKNMIKEDDKIQK